MCARACLCAVHLVKLSTLLLCHVILVLRTTAAAAVVCALSWLSYLSCMHEKLQRGGRLVGMREGLCFHAGALLGARSCT